MNGTVAQNDGEGKKIVRGKNNEKINSEQAK